MQLSDIIRLFPAVIAPAIVAHLRRRWPAIDGLLVWLVVVLVAVALSIGIAALNGQPFLLATVRDGVLMGLAAAGIDTMANGKPLGKPAAAPVPDEAPSAPGTFVAPPPVTPETHGTAPAMQLDFATDPRPSGR